MNRQQSGIIETLKARVYLDPEVMRIEQQNIFATSWQYAGHTEKLAKAGDFIVVEIAGESIIVIREDADTINAFYNLCPHRSARLLHGEGCKKRFSCPYHAWTFNPRGELISAPNANHVPGFEVSNYSLKFCRVEVQHGLVFVNLDDSATALAEQAPELLADLRRYVPNMPELTFVHRTEALLAANWKVGIENYAECYHCEFIHKSLASSVLDFDSYSIETFARSQKHHSGSQQGDARAYQFDDLQASEFVAWWLWPNFSFQSYPGGRAHLWKWTPVDVNHTRLTVDWYFPSKEMAQWETELIRHHAATTFREDQEIIASVQLGLGSRACQPGPLMIDEAKSVLSEHAVAAIQQLWRDAMGVEYE